MAGLGTLLLHLDATPASALRLQIALELAQRHEARVTALFGAVPELEEVRFAYSGAAALDASRLDPYREWHAQAAADLMRLLPIGSDPQVEWCNAVGDAVTEVFVRESAYADLLVIGQQGPGARASGGPPAGFLASVVMECGRPALIVPGAWRGKSVGRRALVAWNGSMQAARALGGALELLRRADEVHVVSWSRQPPVAPCSGLSIGAFLERHGIGATVHAKEPQGDVGAALATLARRLGSDLVVMGCYGRARAAERIFGGATRTLLAAMETPTLMAH